MGLVGLLLINTPQYSLVSGRVERKRLVTSCLSLSPLSLSRTRTPLLHPNKVFTASERRGTP